MNRRIVAIILSLISWGGIGARGEDQPSKHLTVARNLVKVLDLSRTNYEHGEPKVSWVAPVGSHTDCSGFLDALFMHVYGWDKDGMRRWLDAARPTAKRYHDAIAGQHGFRQIQKISELGPGDILAVKYLKRSDSTGHVMLVESKPKERLATAPVVPGTRQWEVGVIDSSKSGHGKTDTRYKKGVDGKDHDGLGSGIFRIYANDSGEVVGFAWSTFGASEFKSPADEHLVMGRLVPGFKP